MKNSVLAIAFIFICFSIFAQSNISLKFNLQKGKVNQLKSISKQNIQNTYNGTPYNSVVNTSSVVSFTLISQDNDQMKIEFLFDTIQSKTSSSMANKETNSAKPAKSKEYLERMLNKFSAEKIIAKISTSGKFIGFENYKAFRDKIMQVMDSVPDNKRDQIQKQADMLLKESSLRTMIEPLFAYLPENPVKQGDKWETTVSQSGGGMSAMMFNTFTLEGVENDQIQLSEKSELESIPSTEPNPMMSSDIKGTSTANMTIDKKTGLILKSSVKGHSEGIITIKNQGNEIKMPMVVDSQSEIIKVK